MIFITGDTHIPIDIGKLSAKRFPRQKEMTKSDYVIICGDFGGVWDNSKENEYWLKWLNNKSFTTLFVDGNHENFERLNQYPVVEFCGGLVHQVESSIFHLMRGEVYVIGGKKIFAMGGASSHDKEYRVEGRSWWPEEIPSDEEFDNAQANLARNNWEVDYVITHCAPDSIQGQISERFTHDKMTNFLEHVVKCDCEYKRWFFGHYHIDKAIDNVHRCLYNEIINLE